jgi:hypothetical protein
MTSVDVIDVIARIPLYILYNKYPKKKARKQTDQQHSSMGGGQLGYGGRKPARKVHSRKLRQRMKVSPIIATGHL